MRSFLSCLLIYFTFSTFSQDNFLLSGKIKGNKEPLPFATIIVKGTTYGANSNVNGDYFLKLPAGTYEIIFQYVGYSKQAEKVIITSNKTLDVSLKEDAISLREVEIKAGEDPAVPIIRKAIRKRKYYLEQLDAFTCMAYIKGLQRINKLPKNMAKLMKIAGGDPADTSDMKGVVYLSESISKYHFEKPDNEKEIMYSSKVSGDNKAFSFNKLGDMDINFYENLINMGGLSPRPLVSPINENAFIFYRYFLVGKIEGEGKVINKIKVVPKRKTDPCFNGFIYIQDSTWRITSADLKLMKETKINFVDSLMIKQLYASVIADSLWLPVTINFGFEFNAFNIRGNGYFNAHIKDYDLHPIFPKNFFKNEVLKVEEGANKKDTAYWNKYRAVPLTDEEKRDYEEKDSIEVVRESDRYKDSVDKKHNKFDFGDLLRGYHYEKSKKKISVSLPGILTKGIQYNTVEGLNLSYNSTIEKEYEDKRVLTFNANARYGFANKLWGGEAAMNYRYDPMKFSRFGINLKSIVEQYNQREPIIAPINSIYTLLLNDNFMKLYKETAAEVSYFTEIRNGIFVNPIIKYAERSSLKNSTDLLLIDDPHKLFTSNDPQRPATDDSLFKINNAFTGEITFSFRFKQKYSTLPDQKMVNGTKYPRLSISYKKAVPVLNSVADYDLVSAATSDRVRLGLLGNFAFNLRGGYFITNKHLEFVDYRHFTGNQTYFLSGDYLATYRLLPYYTYSADQWYVEAHGEHHFNGFIVNKIPLLKKTKLKEVAGAHFLANNRLEYYYEFNFGIEKLFHYIRLDYVFGYTAKGKMRQGATIGLRFDF
jgi:hypothetical protein